MARGRFYTILLLLGVVAYQFDVTLAMAADAQIESGKMAEKRVLTPGGFRPESQVHKIAPGHVLDASGGRLRELDADGNVIADFGPAPAAASVGPGISGTAGTAPPKKSR